MKLNDTGAHTAMLDTAAQIEQKRAAFRAIRPAPKRTTPSTHTPRILESLRGIVSPFISF